MDSHIFIALVGGLVNMALSVTVPCLVKKTNQPFLNDVKKVFELNRQVIITSSLIVAIGQITGFSDSSSYNLTHRPVIIDLDSNPQLKNLVKLIKN